jgi:hypothetical protein
MKLLFCDRCLSVVQLLHIVWQTCVCKTCGGQYNPDSLTATIGGKCRVFGIANPFFWDTFPKDVTALPDFRKRWGYAQQQSECWWGEYEGDWQLLRIKNALGPVPKDWAARVRKLVPGGQLYAWRVKGKRFPESNPAASIKELFDRVGRPVPEGFAVGHEYEGQATVVCVRWHGGRWITEKRSTV